MEGETLRAYGSDSEAFLWTGSSGIFGRGVWRFKELVDASFVGSVTVESAAADCARIDGQVN
jgi:hypothetical protein